MRAPDEVLKLIQDDIAKVTEQNGFKMPDNHQKFRDEIARLLPDDWTVKETEEGVVIEGPAESLRILIFGEDDLTGEEGK